ncbi:phosphoribosyltransferase [Paenibacillus algicola]|uniref:phosphoribosyltransferase n=1 Tax=Paenibacillus algicola TaxID=2565926 RepID=UPI0010FEAC2D|nr:phosphoribosyltransferase [Paenibacillus algicola]
MQIWFAKIGFHDQAGNEYLSSDGKLNIRKIMPQEFYESFSNAVKGKNCLIVDDNFAMGETFKACKTIIEEAGGVGYSRSIESSWSYFERYHKDGGGSGIMVDFPSLRTYFHHTKQVTLINYLCSKEFGKYISEISDLNLLPSLALQIKRNYKRALKITDWPKHTLRVMHSEIKESDNWLAKSSPEKIYK